MDHEKNFNAHLSDGRERAEGKVGISRNVPFELARPLSFARFLAPFQMPDTQKEKLCSLERHYKLVNDVSKTVNTLLYM